MDKPKFITEERRNGVYAVVFGGRFALPSWFVAVILFAGFVTVITLGIVGGVIDNFAMKVPLAVVAGVGALWFVGYGLYKLGKQIALVNKKDLTGRDD